MKVAYYPGCSLHGTAEEYDESTRMVCKALGIELQELEDWNCCGASSAHATNDKLSVALAARNLALAEQSSHGTLLIPCSACFQRLKAADARIKNDQKLGLEIASLIGMPYAGKVEILQIIQMLARPELVEKGRSLKRLFEKVYGRGAHNQLNKYVTQLANEASQRSASEGRSFCAAMATIFERIQEMDGPQFEIGRAHV